MDHSVDFWACLVYRAMDHTFTVRCSTLRIERVASPGQNSIRSLAVTNSGARDRDWKYRRASCGISNADVPKGIDHAFICQDTVCNHEVT